MARRKRRRRSFGFIPSEHLRRAKSVVQVARLEMKVVRKHLAAGQCAPAVRGIAMAGWALGALRAERSGARVNQHDFSKQNIRNTRRVDAIAARTALDLRKLAGKIIKTCHIPERRG